MLIGILQCRIVTKIHIHKQYICPLELKYKSKRCIIGKIYNKCMIWSLISNLIKLSWSWTHSESATKQFVIVVIGFCFEAESPGAGSRRRLYQTPVTSNMVPLYTRQQTDHRNSVTTRQRECACQPRLVCHALPGLHISSLSYLDILIINHLWLLLLRLLMNLLTV